MNAECTAILGCGCCGTGFAAFGFADGCVQEDEAEQAPAEQWQGESEEDQGRDQDTCPVPAEERSAWCRPSDSPVAAAGGAALPPHHAAPDDDSGQPAYISVVPGCAAACECGHTGGEADQAGCEPHPAGSVAAVG